MAPAPPFTITILSVIIADWTPIVPPVNCDGFVINNIGGTDDLLITHDPASGVSSRIYTGNQWPLGRRESPVKRFIGRLYTAGQVLGYLKSTTVSPRDVEITYQ